MTNPVNNAPSQQQVIVKQVAKSGIGMGSALAIAISWSLHKSLLWAIVHGAFGWFYVIYYALTRNRGG
jgi:hypothetical protein